MKPPNLTVYDLDMETGDKGISVINWLLQAGGRKL